MMTDPVADMLTRIRNANNIERPAVEMPATKLKSAIAKVLQDEGFITGFRIGKYEKNAEGHDEFKETANYGEPHVILQVFMKYGPDGERVIRNIQRGSTPGQRVYRGYKDLKRVLDGLGIAILSTSKGVMSDRQARKAKVGGELIATVW
jgi:small subunit ribosomal protein S8